MNLALYTNGQKSVIASLNQKTIPIDSLLLFQNPDLFTSRFFEFIKHKLEVTDPSQIDTIVIALTGLIDEGKKSIVRSTLLNDVSRIKEYEGFSFADAFKGKVPAEKIYLINDAFATALGVSETLPNLSLPCMVISLDEGVGVSFINTTKSIISAEWGGDFVRSINQNIWLALGRESLFGLLLDNVADICGSYTNTLTHVIDYLAEKFKSDNQQIKSVVVLGTKSQIISEEQLKNSLGKYDITVITDENIKNNIYVQGCFGYPSYFKRCLLKPVGIKYYSGGELIYDFKKFEDCTSHFISVKPINNPDNYYKIFFSDGSVKNVVFRELDDVVALERYRF